MRALCVGGSAGLEAQLGESLVRFREDGLVHGAVLLRGRLVASLGRSLRPGLEVEHDALLGNRHAVNEARHAALGSLALLTAGADDQHDATLGTHLALRLGHRSLLLRAEVGGVVVPAVRGDGLDLIGALVVLVEDQAALALDSALASVAHGHDELLGVQLLASVEEHTRRTGLVVNGSRLVAAHHLLALALGLGEIAADDRLHHFGGVVDVGVRGRVDVVLRDEGDDVGEIHGGGSCGLGGRDDSGLGLTVNGSGARLRWAHLPNGPGTWIAGCNGRATHNDRKGRWLAPPPRHVGQKGTFCAAALALAARSSWRQ